MFELVAECNGARAGRLHTAHGVIETPVFMPVATRAAMRAMEPWQLEEMGAQIILANAYHLFLRPGDEIIRDLGGLIINDLIDMRAQKHRRQIEERFQNNLKRDRARSTILRISEFGLIEMTRQRMRPSIRKSHFVRCPQCDGHGEISWRVRVREGKLAELTLSGSASFDQDALRLQLPSAARGVAPPPRASEVELRRRHGVPTRVFAARWRACSPRRICAMRFSAAYLKCFSRNHSM